MRACCGVATAPAAPFWRQGCPSRSGCWRALRTAPGRRSEMEGESSDPKCRRMMTLFFSAPRGLGMASSPYDDVGRRSRRCRIRFRVRTRASRAAWHGWMRACDCSGQDPACSQLAAGLIMSADYGSFVSMWEGLFQHGGQRRRQSQELDASVAWPAPLMSALAGEQPVAWTDAPLLA